MTLAGLHLVVVLSGFMQDSALIARAHDQPDSVRESIRALVASSQLADAQTLARAYALAWRDSFFVREVARFTAWPADTRRVKIAADSLRRAGNAALGRQGVGAAMRAWRESLRRCETIGDSAGMGAALGNIGAGFYQSGELDSAASYFERARLVATRVGDVRTQGNATGALASVTADRGDLRQAAALYARAAEIRAQSGDDRGAAADRNNLGLIAQNLGDLDGARRAFTTALASNRRAARDDAAAVNLVNLGNLASLSGDYPEAAARYDEALGLYRARGDTAKAAAVRQDIGLLALQRGDYGAALASLLDALATFRTTGPVTAVIRVHSDLAITYAAMGNLQGALAQLGTAERLAARQGVGSDVATELALSRADLEAEFNNVGAATRQYTRAAQLARRAADDRGTADAQRGLGALLLEQEDYAGARAQLAAALRTENRSGDSRSAALTRVVLGSAELRLGDVAGARRTLTQALDTLQAIGDSGGAAAALGTLADLELQVGLPLVAESLYRRALARLGTVTAPTLSWQLHAGLADALRHQGGGGTPRDALSEYRAAIRDIESAAGTLRQSERRAAFAADKWDVYAQVARLELESGHADSAFDWSEQLRARQLLDLLGRGHLGGLAKPASAAQVEREQDLRRQITVLMGRLEAASSPSPDGRGGQGVGVRTRGPLGSDSATGAVREALARAQDAYAALLRDMRENEPEYAALVTAQTAPAREVRRALPPDAAILEYLLDDSTSTVFLVTADTIAAIELGVDRHELAKLAEFTRGLLTGPSRTTATGLWRAPLRRLYRDLIEPVEASGLLAGKQALIIAPHAELHYVPFAALLASESPDQYLVQRYRITTVPSASVWLALRRRDDARASGAAAASRVLALAPRVTALPGSAAEVGAIERLYGTRALVLTGPRASKRALRDAASGREIIHFATYGVLNKDNPLFSFVELSAAGSDDGRLEVHEVFGLDLHARLVVLSACQTALGAGTLADVPQGDDWVSLVEAFHFAGASKVLATLWPVEDRATADLMALFYAALEAGRPESEALAEAQRTILRKNPTAHPFYWAGFTLSGTDQ
ncbi:MAG TPA: CHAT domain-containing tetratricopeptide repeat protein [Gemmatimonadales bacterium]|nr:CHAT domain-containing tetratricopeptide repeat protein [Gemmatimonadales bacterium]